jgi:hypothetical protein
MSSLTIRILKVLKFSRLTNPLKKQPHLTKVDIPHSAQNKEAGMHHLRYLTFQLEKKKKLSPQYKPPKLNSQTLEKD